MEARISASGLLNDSQNLAFYTELVKLKFQGNASIRDAHFKSPSKSQQTILHYLADAMGLQYEYALATETVTITKEHQSAAFQMPESGPFDWFHRQLYGDTSSVAGETLPSNTLADQAAPLHSHTEGFNLSGTFLDSDFDNSSNFLSNQSGPFEQTQGAWSEGISGLQTPMTEGGAVYRVTNTTPHSYTNVGETRFGPGSDDDPYAGGVSAFVIEHSPPLDPSLPDLSFPLHPPFDEDLYLQDNSNLRSSHNSPKSSTLQISSSPKKVASTLGQNPDKNVRSKKRKPTIDSPASSLYHEKVFNSSMEYASSQLSLASGKNGPRDDHSKTEAAMVKLLGGCWKCKFRRKKCETETPCDECRKSSPNSLWLAVGCKRRTSLKVYMIPIRLCPQVKSSNTLDAPESDEQWGAANRLGAATNRYLTDLVDDREQNFEVLGSFAAGHVKGDTEWSRENKILLEIIPRSRFSRFCKPDFPMLLIEHILAIVWEIQKIPWSCTILEREQLDDFVNLLRSAAHLQAVTKTDQLVAKSLLCLRSSLEALHIKTHNPLLNPSHKACSGPSCQFMYLANLDLSLEEYLDEQDRVFFNKKNQHHRETWWLSAFYSFCIQSIVRRALIDLIGPQNKSSNLDGAVEYLHLAVRLFLADSASYDPLIKYPAPKSETGPRHNSTMTQDQRYKEAQLAVQRVSWESQGIRSSGEYLQRQFEDYGGDLKEPVIEKNIPKNPSLPPPSTSDIDDTASISVYSNPAKKTRLRSPLTPRLTAQVSPGVTSARAVGLDDIDSWSEFALER